MIQGPEPGEYRGLTLEEQRQMNAMYRELNAWNAHALRVIEERGLDRCTCETFAVTHEPACPLASTGTERPAE